MIKKVKQSLMYIFIFLVGFFGLMNVTFAQDLLKNDVKEIRIVPIPNNQPLLDTYISIQKGDAEGGKPFRSFWERYEYATNELEKTGDLGSQLAGGFVNFNTILFYLAYLIRVISNIAIAIAALFIIRGGYEYTLQAFGYKQEKTTSYIKNIVIGIFIMAFAYGIIRILAFTFLF